jgi:hypothetical protein
VKWAAFLLAVMALTMAFDAQRQISALGSKLNTLQASISAAAESLK